LVHAEFPQQSELTSHTSEHTVEVLRHDAENPVGSNLSAKLSIYNDNSGRQGIHSLNPFDLDY